MDPQIKQLKSTTFYGRRFTRRQLAQIQETVALFPALSRKELAQTICEHLQWRTPSGSNRVAACVSLLEALQQHGILTLPPKRENRHPRRHPIAPTARSDPQPRIEAPLMELTPLRLQATAGGEQTALFNEYVERYHYLGYRQPLGPHLRYLLRDRQQRPLGCLLFSQATRSLACRDAWVGWRAGEYKQHLDLVVGQPRFLLLPWVRVDNLASHALALAVQQLPQDWQRLHGRRPVLIETFVDPARFAGTCYRAANWLHVGQTRGSDARRSPKDVYLYPLAKNCRQILLHGPPKPPSKPRPPRQATPASGAPDEAFVRLWQDLIDALGSVASAHDQIWQVRRRVLDTRLVMLFVFRLVFAARRQGYTATLAELWDHCRALGVPLPQPSPVSDAAMVRARRKVDPLVFRHFHAEILRRADQPGPLWLGHRVFAVDGSKLTLPRPLREAGYPLPHPQAHYPQGLLSCLYRLHAKLPVDFNLHAHANERAAALAHLKLLAPSDLLVYDRGYYCFELLCAHRWQRLQAVFRLPRNVCPAIDAFFDSQRTDTLVSMLPGPDTLRALSRKYPDTLFEPLPLRLVKYTHAATTYVLGTTLLDRRRYRVSDLSDLYHARWGIEELYKVSKEFLQVDQFHGRSEPLVRQELWAHFNLIALTRSFTNHDAALCSAVGASAGKPLPQANFKHSLATLSRHLEALLLRHTEFVRETVTHIAACVGIGRRRPRPHRSYPRRSRQPAPKWSRRKPIPA